MAGRTSRRLVIDASVLAAAGGLDKTHPTGASCREFLREVRSVCHRIILTDDIATEWDRHRSNYSATWRQSMVSLRKVDARVLEGSSDLRARIADSTADPSVARIMLKDLRLIEAALAADSIVVSLDEAVHGHFARAAVRIEELRAIVWVNPTVPTEQSIRWLKAGAKGEKARRLGYYLP